MKIQFNDGTEQVIHLRDGLAAFALMVILIVGVALA